MIFFSDTVNNAPIQVQLTGNGQTWEQVKRVLYQSIHSFGTEFFGEPLNYGQMDIVDFSFGSVGQDREQDEHVLYQRIQFSDTGILGEALKDRQNDIEDTLSGSVLIRLRPVTDQAVQNLISAKENNNLLQMVFGILRRLNITKLMSEKESLQIQIKVFYDSLATPKRGKF